MTTKIYSSLTDKFRALLAESMPELTEEAMKSWLDNPEDLQRALEEGPGPKFNIWKTLEIGRKTGDDYRRAFQEGGYGTNFIVDEMLGTIGIRRDGEEKVDLIITSGATLGWKIDRLSFTSILERAAEYDLRHCDWKVGPELRLAYKNQPEGEWLVIVMNPHRWTQYSSIGAFSHEELFALGREGTSLKLGTVDVGDNHPFSKDQKFVFTLPRSEA